MALKLAVMAFAGAAMPTPGMAKSLVRTLGFTSDRIAVAFTLPAFFNPSRYPMVDREVAGWVNANLGPHNVWGTGMPRPTPLAAFLMNRTSLAFNDFGAYCAWVSWCRAQAAALLVLQPLVGWTARDVEMAVFAQIRGNYPLPLPVL